MSEIFIFLSIIIFLIICSAFFSSSETALTAVSEARINELVTQGSKRAKLIEKILKNREKMISTILIGNNFVNVIASVYTTSFAIMYFQEVKLILVTIILTIILIIFAEVIPKTYALKNADQIALNVAPLINLTIFILTPATLFTEKLARSVTGPIMNDDEAKTQELKGMIRQLNPGSPILTGSKKPSAGELLAVLLSELKEKGNWIDLPVGKEFKLTKKDLLKIYDRILPAT